MAHRGGERVKKSAIEHLVSKTDDLYNNKKYWYAQGQILRDEGQSYGFFQQEIDGKTVYDINEDLKQRAIEDIQDKQRESLSQWANYFEQESDRYPDWFKYYAWEGMSRMGTFNKQKSLYNKRSKSSVAPYPSLNQAALAKVKDTLEANFDQQQFNDELLEGLAKTGNFNKLYSHFLLNSKEIIPTPE